MHHAHAAALRRAGLLTARELAAIKFEAWKVENPEGERYLPPKRWRGD
jgi:hypothetical protein